ncbi:MAG TPA: DUF2341 domain-containing protein [Verrucomicrobiae bacterium]|nr:DUF2341 domain-containing protein [Verrucomicrobiae bacterium]
MQKSTLARLLGIVLILGACVTTWAQNYSNTVMGLNPAGYWPLNETAQPPQVLNLTATNSGSAGAAGDGYYGGWYQPSGNQWYLTNNIVTEPGPVAGADLALNCQKTQGQYIILPRRTNGVANAAVTIKAPFSIEAWVNLGTITSGLLTIISEGGETTMNIGGPNPTNQFNGGPTVGWDGFSLGTYQNFFFFDCYETNGESKVNEVDSPTNSWVGQWVHVVCTYNGSQEIMYTNGVLAKQKTVNPNGAGQTYVVDPTSPLIIGAGPAEPVSYGNATWGGLAEVAIYPTALTGTQVQNHYLAATSVATYTNTILADGPSLYFRMNDGATQANAGYPSALFPVATNLGTLGTAANAVYQMGTTPGVAGPPYAGFGANSKSVSINGWLGAVDVGNSNLPSELNPTGAVPMSVVAWYQTGPADSPGRFQEILGHSDASYRLALGQNTGDAENHFNPGPGPELQFTSAAQVNNNGYAFNDGAWHMVAGISDGTNEYLYLDGSLALSNNNPAGIKIVGSTQDLLLGGDPEYTYPTWGGPYNSIRTFDGNVAQVAFFTNALTAAQIQSLFNAAEVPPYFWQEPVSSATANQGQTVTVSTGVRGSSVTYQWYTTNGVAVSGQTNSSLIFAPAVAGNSGAYYLVASGGFGSATSSVVNVTIYGSPFIISQTPAQLEIFSNASPTLFVTVSGATPSYQWKLGTTVIPGATNATYTITNITLAGTYNCTITNVAGTTNITPVAITVLTDPIAPYPAQVLANGPISYYRLDEPNGVTTAYDYVGGFNADYTNTAGFQGEPGYSSQNAVNTDPSETSVYFGAASTVNSLANDVAPFPNFSTPNGQNAEFTVEAWVQEVGYNSLGDCIVGVGFGGGGEQFVLDTGATASGYVRFFVRNAAGTVSGASSSALINGDGLWHHVVGVCDEAGGHLYLYMDGRQLGSATITPGSGLLASSMPMTIGARQSGNYNPPNYDYQFDGLIDDVSIYNKALSAAQVLTDYNAVGFVPSNAQVTPSNLTTNQGATAVFTATAQGTQPISYQWRDNNNNVIPSGTNATLVLANVQPSQAGTYTVTVLNAYGSTTASATLAVTQAPQFVQNIEPTNVISYVAYPVTLSVQASGTPPLSYQWYQDGSAVAGATNSSYSFGALLGTNSYYCTITNIYSAGTPLVSSTATVVGVTGIAAVNPANYNSHLKITFSGYTNSETLQYFPALVRLSTNLTGFSYGQFLTPNGTDLRFADSTGTNQLAYEVDQWDDSNGISSFWVQVPALSGGTNNAIYAYWGNPNDTTPPAYTTNGAVWEPAAFLGLPGYDVVYHLKESAFPFVDSTTNYPALGGNAPAPVQGIVGYGERFAGGNYLDAGTVNLGNQFTESAWVNLAPTASNIQGIWDNGPGGYSTAEADLFINDYNTADGAVLFGTDNNQPETATGLVLPGAWHLVTAAINRANGSIQFYVDGNPEAVSGSGSPGVSTDFPTNNDMDLGRFTAGAFPFTGVMDEARIYGGIEDSNWVSAEYNTIANNSTFSTYSTVASTITLPITLTIRTVGNQAILTWPGGTLQSASNLNGPYSNVTGATSPYTNSISGTQLYFRVQAQLP